MAGLSGRRNLQPSCEIMALLSLITVSSRTATLLLAPEGTLYHLGEPVPYTLTAQPGGCVADGTATAAVLHVSGLTPETGYTLSTSLGDLTFRTRACGGSVDAAGFGADPEAEDNTAALQRAIDAVPENGTLIVPPGRYWTGPLFLRSHMTLYLSEGAELAALSDWQNWPVLPARDGHNRVVGTWEGLPEPCFAALINAVGCTGLTLTGKGILDGGGDRGDWWDWPKETRRGARRPRTVFLAHCTHVTLSGLTVRNSPSWTVHPFQCRSLLAAGLSIQNPPDSPNTDGFNPESCEDVTLTGLHFSVGDDCIAIKAGKRDSAHGTDHLASCRNISIRHCLMERGHGAVVLGSEMSGGITDIRIANCAFLRTDRGLRIKTRRGRGGRVARVSLTDVHMCEVDTAICANAFYFCDADGKSAFVQSRQLAPVTEGTPDITGITVKNVIAEKVRLAAVALLGLPEAPLSGIEISGLKVSFDPEAEAGVPLMACGVPACRHEQIVAEFAGFSGAISPLEQEAGRAD